MDKLQPAGNCSSEKRADSNIYRINIDLSRYFSIPQEVTWLIYSMQPSQVTVSKNAVKNKHKLVFSYEIVNNYICCV